MSRRLARRWIAAVGVALSSGHLLPSAMAAKPAPPPDVTGLVALGQAQFAAGRNELAEATFAGAVAADPTNVAANRGLGFARLRLRNFKGADGPLRVAVDRATGKPDRSLALAVAAVKVETGSAMAAVRILVAALQGKTASPDEGLVNALGIALSRPEATAASRGTLFAQAQSLYMLHNAALERRRPGERRWGTTWGPADEVGHEFGAWTSARQAVADDAARVAQIKSDRQAAIDRLQGASASLGYRNAFARRDAIDRDNKQVADLGTQLNQAQDKLDRDRQALSVVPAPTFPDAVPTDDIQLVPTPSATLASVAPPAPARPAPTVPLDPAPTPSAVVVPPVVPARQRDRAVAPSKRGVGFAIAPDMIVTAADVVAGAGRVRIELRSGLPMAATVVRTDAATGLALLRADGAGLPSLSLAATVTAGPLRCGGFPKTTLFGSAAELTDGSAAAPRAGETWSVRLDDAPQSPGGPLIGPDGSVVGICLRAGGDPASVSAVPAAALRTFVGNDVAPLVQAREDPRRAIVQVVADPP